MKDECLVKILDNSKTLSDVSRQLLGGDSYSKREKTKNILFENGIDWVEWKKSKNNRECVCQNCGKRFLRKDKRKKFCCSSCAASFNNKGRKHTKETREKISQTMQARLNGFDGVYKPLRYEKGNGVCKYCGKTLRNKRSLFCDNTCYSKFKSEEYIKRWKEGKENGLSGKYDIKECVREYLIEERNNCCEICGCNLINPYTHKTILQIHHKDGDCTNNKPENLQVLCPNCHAMTDNFGSRNKNATRKDNRKRY